MSFELTEVQKDFQDSARQFAAERFAPHAAKWDGEKIFPVETIKECGAMGFCGLYMPEELGGLGLSRTDASIIFEELAAGCPSTTAYITIHNMVTWVVATFGKQEVREEFVPSLASGEQLGSYCLTEPNAGSDAASLRTTAEKQGDHYIVNGAKAFISGAGATQILVVMARTGDKSPRGISCFMIPADLEGIEYGANEKKMGWNSQPTKMIHFKNVKVPSQYLLGEEGEGFKIAMMGLDGGRINIGTCSVGAAQAAINETRRYIHEREQFGKKIGSFQALQFRLADMQTKLVAARQMIRLAAHKLDSNDPQKTQFCAMAKLFATDECFNICNEAIQFFGGYGYTHEYPLERLMRDCRVHQILEGTNEIMRVIISRTCLKEGTEGDIR